MGLTECKRKSLLWLHPPSKSRSLLLQKENTLYGSEVPFWPLSQPSNRCGSQNKNMTNVVHQLFTENAFKCFLLNKIFILITRVCDKISKIKLSNIKQKSTLMKNKNKYHFPEKK